LVGRFPDPSDLALQPLIQAGLAADCREHEAADYRPGGAASGSSSADFADLIAEKRRNNAR
jgi:hypothetical protein